LPSAWQKVLLAEWNRPESCVASFRPTGIVPSLVAEGLRPPAAASIFRKHLQQVLATLWPLDDEVAPQRPSFDNDANCLCACKHTCRLRIIIVGFPIQRERERPGYQNSRNTYAAWLCIRVSLAQPSLTVTAMVTRPENLGHLHEP
jgi:hypothetical protein